MSFLVQHIRSGENGKRPQPLDLAPGQLAVNYNADSPGLFFRTDTGTLVKAGPVHVGSTAPAPIGYSERSIGELWFQTGVVPPYTTPENSLQVYTESGWVPAAVPNGSVTTEKIVNGAVTAAKITLNNTLIPTVNNAFDFGSSVSRLSVIYTETLNSNKISSTIVPSVDNSFNLGSPSFRFANIYTGDLHLKNDRGDWTLIEEDDCLTLRNNKTGNRFKIVMEPID